MKKMKVKSLNEADDIAMQFAMLEKGLREHERQHEEKYSSKPPKIEEISTVGYVGSLPKLFINAEKPSARFRVAVKKGGGQVTWMTVNLRGEKGINIARSIIKGMTIFVSGKHFSFPHPHTGEEDAGRQVIYANQIFKLEPLSA